MILTADRDPEAPATTVACPTCEGSGQQHYNIARDPATGVWTSDTRACTACSGTGSVSETDAVVCTACGTRTTWRGTACPDHDDLCSEHRPHGCGDCADDGDWNPTGYYGPGAA